MFALAAENYFVSTDFSGLCSGLFVVFNLVEDPYFELTSSSNFLAFFDS